MNFRVDSIGIYPPDPAKAEKLLEKVFGKRLETRAQHVTGQVFGSYVQGLKLVRHFGQNIEMVEQVYGANAMDLRPDTDPNRIGYLGMDITEDQVAAIIRELGPFGFAEVLEITNSRERELLFNTHSSLGFDLKFTVRRSV